LIFPIPETYSLLLFVLFFHYDMQSRGAIMDINDHPLHGGVNNQYLNGPRGKVGGPTPSIFGTETSGTNTMSMSEGGEIEISGPSPIGFGSSTSPPSNYVRM
jgi:hypothetical protein